MRLYPLTLIFATSLASLALYAHAEPTLTNNLGSAHPWSLEVGLGLGQYEDMQSSDGNTALGRLGIGKNLLHWKQLYAGIESAFQTGNDARVSASPIIINTMGGLPLDTVMKSTLDLLLTGKWYPTIENPLFFLIKGGLILRRWQFRLNTVNDLTRVSPELQLGAGTDISPSASLSLSYQRIQGSDPHLHLVSADGLAAITSIPAENALILDLSLSLL